MEKEKISISQKGKKGIYRIIFGRTAVIAILLLIQIMILISTYLWIREYSIFLYIAFELLGAVVVIYIINKSGNPSFKLMWIVLILIVPVFGELLYLFVKLQRDTKLIERRLEQLAIETIDYCKQKQQIMNELEEDNPEVKSLAVYMNNCGGFPIYKNTSVEYFSCGVEKFEEMKKQLELATHFIFMEYFIVEEGYMWDSILEILKRKVMQGVEVRFMYDGMCSLVLLPYKYPEQLKAFGIQSKMFAPIKPVLSSYQNNRDHRKILVIDGHTAFTGGINLADEYIDRKVRFGYWKDTAIMLKGDAVKSFTIMFLQMWNIDVKTKEDYERYLHVSQVKFPSTGDGYVMPYADSPLDDEQIGASVYMDILYTAKRYVHIMTPYLILDNELMTALTYTAKRGVEVIIMMPHIPDKWYAFMVAKTYYAELIEAGIQIYEFTPGFIHAKSFTSDDEKAVVGTINLDYRSLYLHFECAAYMYKNKEIKRIEEDFQKTLLQCQKISLFDCNQQNIFKNLAGKLLRILAPLM